MSGIQGITFDNQVVTAKDHGRLFQCLLRDGVISGCAITKTNTSVTVGTGYLLVAGRLIRITTTQTLYITTPSTPGFFRVIVTVNLTGTATTTEFGQVALSTEFSRTVDTFRDLTQGDVNGTATLYEYELCIVYSLTSGITYVWRQPTKASIDPVQLDTIPVSQGGTGRTTLGEHYVLIGEGTGAVVGITPATAGYILMSNGTGADPAFKAQTNITQVGTITAGTWHGGVIPVAYGGTGQTNAANALKAMFAAGATILSSNQYGATLPAAGTAGRLFFKTVG